MKLFPVSLIFAAYAISSTGTSEQLRYTINWPSSLSLGEAQLRSSPVNATSGRLERLGFNFSVDAGIPGFQVLDNFKAESTPEFCSFEFEKKTQHGSHKTDEKTDFDSAKGVATRETAGGGKSEVDSGSCPKDALTYLYFVRHELKQGRLPGPQTVFYGGKYEVRLEFGGTQTIKVGETSAEADRLTGTVKGSGGQSTFEIFFLKDAARTPALVKVPLALGTFSMELVR